MLCLLPTWTLWWQPGDIGGGLGARNGSFRLARVIFAKLATDRVVAATRWRERAFAQSFNEPAHARRAGLDHHEGGGASLFAGERFLPVRRDG